MKIDDLKNKLISCVDVNYNVVQHERVSELLIKLKDADITKSELEESRLGKIVNSIRKNNKDQNVIDLSKSLIKHWQAKFLSNGKNETPKKPPLVPNAPEPNKKSPQVVKNKNFPPKEEIPATKIESKPNKSAVKRRRIQTTAELICSLNVGEQKIVSSETINRIGLISSETSLKEEINGYVDVSKPKRRNSFHPEKIKGESTNVPSRVKETKQAESKEPLLVKIKLPDMFSNVKNTQSQESCDISKSSEPEKSPKSSITKSSIERHELSIPSLPEMSPRSVYRKRILDALPKYDRNNLPAISWETSSRNINGSHDGEGKLKDWKECYRLPSLDDDICVILPYCDMQEVHIMKLGG